MTLCNEIARYGRLCKRYDELQALTEKELRNAAARAIPSTIRKKMSIFWYTIPWDQLWETALTLELQNRKYQRHDHSSSGVYAADDVPMSTESRTQVARSAAKGIDPTKTPYPACGGLGHFKKTCLYAKYRCTNCMRIGHISKICRNLVTKDPRGRVDVRVEPKPSGTAFTQRQDRHLRDQVETSEQLLGKLRAGAEMQATKASASRAKRKAEKGWTRKVQLLDHPVHSAEPEGNSPSESESEESDTDKRQLKTPTTTPEDESYILSVEQSFAKATNGTVTLQAKIDGKETKVIIDSGACQSLCSVNTARKLGLKLTEATKNFRGLGHNKGAICRLTLVEFPNRSLPVVFCAVPQPDLPTLIGASDLRKLEILIDPLRNRILDRYSLEVIAVAQEMKQPPSADVLNWSEYQKDQSEKRKEFHDYLDQILDHVKDNKGLVERVHRVFAAYEATWIAPIAGGAINYHARFQVHGDPVKMKLRRLTPKLEEELDKQLDGMLAAGVIQPSKSPWGAVPVFVQKKGGNWRICLDYCALNEHMVPDRYPLPILWQQVQKAAHHKYYIVLDLNWGFWGMPLARSSRKYTAFLTHRGSFEFTVLPFGIKNAPSEFQRLMDSVLQPLYPEGVVCYIDDIVIYGNEPFAMLLTLNRVLGRLEEARLTIKAAKCQLLQPRIKMLGHFIGPEGILPDRDKVRAVRNARHPQTKYELKELLRAYKLLV